MKLDHKTLNLAAPLLCTFGSLVALLSTLRHGPRSLGSVLSSLLGLVGSAAWAASAYQDSIELDAVADATAAA